jgi:hypothetical protein
MSSERLAHRVRRLLGRSDIKPGHDERSAAQALGYVRRADHPWPAPRPLNPNASAGVEPVRTRGEREEFEGAKDFTG